MESAPDRNVFVSIVTPAYCEEGNLLPLYNGIVNALANSEFIWELLIIDDGSKDNTWQEICDIRNGDKRVKGIRLSRNFGHQYALLAGLQHAAGDAIITMDADMQHPPSILPMLVKEWQKGYKIVKTIRQNPPDYSFAKKITSKLFYKIFAFASGVELKSGMADYRLLDRKVLNDIMKFREEGLFLRGIVEWVGYKNTSLVYQCASRYSGASKYTVRKMISFAWHGVSSFSVVPLRLGVLIGFVASGLAFTSVLYAIVSKLIAGHAIAGWASTLAIISFLFGVLFVFLGILGEYIGRILIETRQRPRYLISEYAGLDSLENSLTSHEK